MRQRRSPGNFGVGSHPGVLRVKKRAVVLLRRSHVLAPHAGLLIRKAKRLAAQRVQISDGGGIRRRNLLLPQRFQMAIRCQPEGERHGKQVQRRSRPGEGNSTPDQHRSPTVKSKKSTCSHGANSLKMNSAADVTAQISTSIKKLRIGDRGNASLAERLPSRWMIASQTFLRCRPSTVQELTAAHVARVLVHPGVLFPSC
mmetsp:Transcript_85976/g.229944  ORF Transcript_85976/g.229944 Transcript_85976/m.229944 type:complete len:200 (-) Transcript_85976:216-815(-)